jgi:hypothetical protein
LGGAQDVAPVIFVRDLPKRETKKKEKKRLKKKKRRKRERESIYHMSQQPRQADWMRE